MPMKIAAWVLRMISGSSMTPSRQEKLVEQALGLQDADPGVDADQERGPERQDDQHQEHRPDGRRCSRDAIGYRVADEQRKKGGYGRDHDARHIGVEVKRVAGEPDVIVEVQFGKLRQEAADALFQAEHGNIGRHGDRRLRQRYLEDDDKGDEEENEQPKIGHDDDEAADNRRDRPRKRGRACRRAFGHGLFRHGDIRHCRSYRVSTTPASGWKDIQARSFQVSGSSVRRELFSALAFTTCPSGSLTW